MREIEKNMIELWDAFANGPYDDLFLKWINDNCLAENHEQKIEWR